MDVARFDRSIKSLVQATGRRDAVRSLGASGLALLAVLGFADASAKEPNKADGKDNKHGAHHRGRKRKDHDRGQNTDQDDANPFTSDGALATDSQERVQSDGKGKKKRKKKRGSTSPAGVEFKSRLVISEKSNGLVPEAGNQAVAAADCGGDGKVVSCGYKVDPGAGGGVDQFVNTFVLEAAPNSDGSGCRAILIRTSGEGSVAGATIRAVAVCRE